MGFSMQNPKEPKFVLIALVAVLSLAVLPSSSVYASGLADETTPPEKTEITGERLEKAWERVLKLNERIGKIFERSDTLTKKIQTLIDKATEKGKDTAAVQAALDAFNASADEAWPLYESAQALITAHEGFDADGKVTDLENAAETVKSLKESYREIREITGDSGKSLREAIKAFRETNPREEKPERERPNGESPTFAPSTNS